MKPVVTYKEIYVEPKVGNHAIIGGLKGHPRQEELAEVPLEGRVVHTSRVIGVRYADDKLVEFETENTIYRPEVA